VKQQACLPLFFNPLTWNHLPMEKKIRIDSASHLRACAILESTRGVVRVRCDSGPAKIETFKNFLVFTKKIEANNRRVIVPWMTREQAEAGDADCDEIGHYGLPVVFPVKDDLNFKGQVTPEIHSANILKLDGKRVIIPYRVPDKPVLYAGRDCGLFKLFAEVPPASVNAHGGLDGVIGFVPEIGSKLFGNEKLICSDAYDVFHKYFAQCDITNTKGVFLICYDGIGHTAVQFKPGELIHKGTHATHVYPIPKDATTARIESLIEAYVAKMKNDLPGKFRGEVPVAIVNIT
jgi:hypothetical protein